jgi:hypothetical protein
MTDKGFISFRGGKIRVSPGVNPLIRAIKLMKIIDSLLEG